MKKTLNHLIKESWLLNHSCYVAHRLSFPIFTWSWVLFHCPLTYLFGQQLLGDTQLPGSCLREMCFFSDKRKFQVVRGRGPGDKAYKKKLLKKRSFSPPFVHSTPWPRPHSWQNSCVRTCVGKFLQQGCIVQTACVPGACGSCVPSGQREQIALQTGSRAGGLRENCPTRKARSKGWSCRKSQEVWESVGDHPKIASLPSWLLSNLNLEGNSAIVLTFSFSPLFPLSLLQAWFLARAFCPLSDSLSWAPRVKERELGKANKETKKQK